MKGFTKQANRDTSQENSPVMCMLVIRTSWGPKQFDSHKPKYNEKHEWESPSLQRAMWGFDVRRKCLNHNVKPEAPGGGGNSHMKLTGIYIVSLRGVNFGLGYTLSRWGCSAHSTNTLSRQETQNYLNRNGNNIFFSTCFVFVFLRF